MFKKLLIFSIALFLTISIVAQGNSIEQEEYEDNYLKKEELKLNIGYVPWGYTEISYEKLFNYSNTSVGLSIGKSLFHKKVDYDDLLDVKIAVIPHFRLYFGKKSCAGFFIEATAVYYNWEEEERWSSRSRNHQSLGTGFALGGKLIRDDGFVIEFFAGFGKSLLDVNDSDYEWGYPRCGVMFGKRIW